MKREHVLSQLLAAGYHEDRAAFTRLYVENRVSYAAAKKAYEQGRAAKARGVRCTCNDCRKQQGANIMKTTIALLFVTLPSACLDFDRGSLIAGGDPTVGLDGVSDIEAIAVPPVVPVVCVNDCYTITIDRSYFYVPEPALSVSAVLNGQPIGMTTSLDESQLIMYPDGLYLARWDQAIATVSLHVGDSMFVGLYSGGSSLVARCDLTLVDPYLNNPNHPSSNQIACYEDVASIYLTFIKEQP